MGVLYRSLDMRAVVAGVVVALVVGFAGRAEAACHAFTVSASPSSIAEGGKVTVTVERDAEVRPSGIRVTTVNESATAPADYSKLDQRVEFTSGTSRTLEILVADDGASEGAETFRLHLSEPSGCEVNTNYQVGPDAGVTIQASDPIPPPAQAPVARATPAPQAKASPARTQSPSPTPAVDDTATPSPSPTLSPLAVAEEDDGGFPIGALIGLIAGGLAVATGIGLLIYRRMRMA